ncbi:MAG: DUF3106 domain-containing protein [Betaproteobacteria bacterium]|nr:DUF3106 domain-containing protein [Betaproteobacteria bacterium]
MAETAGLASGRDSAGQVAPPYAVWLAVLLRIALLAAMLLLLGSVSAIAAQPQQKRNPVWTDLTSQEREILAPLAEDWNNLDPARKRKWRGIANRYPKMNPTAQRRVQMRMEAWAKLTPEQRRAARDGYRRIEKIPPEKRKDLRKNWEEYKALPPQQRKASRNAKSPKTDASAPPTQPDVAPGAAPGAAPKSPAAGLAPPDRGDAPSIDSGK